jgi:hypothetical protein
MNNITPFSIVYNNFLSKITDDMYMELTELDTYKMLQELLISALPHFEFPRVDINDYEESYLEDEDVYCGQDSDNKEVKIFIYNGGNFNVSLSNEEINIISTYMIVE